MNHGSSFHLSQAPQVLQCRAKTSRHSVRMACVGGDPHISTTTGGDFAMSLRGPMIFLRQYSAPLRSRLTQAFIRNNAIPASKRGNAITAPSQRLRLNSASLIIAPQSLAFVWLRRIGDFLNSACSNLLNERHNPRAEASHHMTGKSEPYCTCGAI